VVADALDADAVVATVQRARPEAVIHQLTAIPPRINLRAFERDFALTNRLRTEGTRHLVAAARAAGGDLSDLWWASQRESARSADVALLDRELHDATRHLRLVRTRTRHVLAWPPGVTG
jgi:hypothetical protein